MTNREYLAFIEDGGYSGPSSGSPTAGPRAAGTAGPPPLLGGRRRVGWRVFTLAGMRDLDLDEPVCHVSYYEADAFARWAGARLATEAEWETAATAQGRASRGISSSRSGFIRRRARARRPLASSDARPALRRRLGMDAEPLHALSRLPPGRGRAGRVQRQVHVQPDGAPRRLVRHAQVAHPADLPQLLPARGPLAVLGHPAGAQHVIVREYGHSIYRF